MKNNKNKTIVFNKENLSDNMFNFQFSDEEQVIYNTVKKETIKQQYIKKQDNYSSDVFILKANDDVITQIIPEKTIFIDKKVKENETIFYEKENNKPVIYDKMNTKQNKIYINTNVGKLCSKLDKKRGYYGILIYFISKNDELIEISFTKFLDEKNIKTTCLETLNGNEFNQFYVNIDDCLTEKKGNSDEIH